MKRTAIAAALLAAGLCLTPGARAEGQPASRPAGGPAVPGPDLKALFDQAAAPAGFTPKMEDFMRDWRWEGSNGAALPFAGLKDFKGSLQIGWRRFEKQDMAYYYAQAGEFGSLADTEEIAGSAEGVFTHFYNAADDARVAVVCRLISAKTMVCGSAVTRLGLHVLAEEAVQAPGARFDLFRADGRL